MIYEKFRNSSLDLTALGLQDAPSDSKSCQIPNDARVMGWLTDSSIYFCQMPEQGDMVFAVDPNASSEEQIVPVAENILSFIGLLVCCKDAALIAGAYQWSSYRFQTLVDAVNPGMKARSVIRALENIYQPPVIDNPGAMMLRLRKELYDPSRKSDWKVGFENDFSQPCLKGEEELALDRSLTQEDRTWHVPSIYLCEEGIVVDTYLEVSVESVKDFDSNWGNRSEKPLSLADKQQRQLDDPLTAAVTGILSVNDRPLRCKRTFDAVWNPLSDNDAQVRGILKHYRLDPDQGYLFKRYCFLRKGKYPLIRTMHLTLAAIPVMVPDQSFTVHKDGMKFRLIHPVTGLEHSFTALSQSSEALNPNFLTNHPCFYTRLNYALEPSISPENFRVVDQAPSDLWEDYQDDPASVIYAGRKPAPGRHALSSLHYEPQEQVRWQLMFRRKVHNDVQLQLLP